MFGPVMVIFKARDDTDALRIVSLVMFLVGMTDLTCVAGVPVS